MEREKERSVIRGAPDHSFVNVKQSPRMRAPPDSSQEFYYISEFATFIYNVISMEKAGKSGVKKDP